MDRGTAGTERQLRIRARSAAGRVAGAANYKHGLAAQRARTACPYVFPERPLFRTVAPYARRFTPDQRNNVRASASFHTGYKCDRVHQRSDPQSGQRAWSLPHRAGRAQVRLSGDHESRSEGHRAETLVQPLEERTKRLRDDLRRPPIHPPAITMRPGNSSPVSMAHRSSPSRSFLLAPTALRGLHLMGAAGLAAGQTRVR